jgi:hypothetical protein
MMMRLQMLYLERSRELVRRSRQAGGWRKSSLTPGSCNEPHNQRNFLKRIYKATQIDSIIAIAIGYPYGASSSGISMKFMP